MSGRRRIAGCLVGVMIMVAAFAWFASADGQTGNRQPDVGRGAVIAAQGTAAGAPVAAFAQGMRRNDINEQMRTIAKQLTADEMHGVAAWYGAESALVAARR